MSALRDRIARWIVNATMRHVATRQYRRNIQLCIETGKQVLDRALELQDQGQLHEVAPESDR